MRKYIVWEDGHKRELTPLSFKEFMVLDLWTGGSDLAWSAWLHKNNFHEADSFNDEALDEGKFVITDEPLEFSKLLFSVDGERWQPYEDVKDHKKTLPWEKKQLLKYFKDDYVQPEDR